MTFVIEYDRQKGIVVLLKSFDDRRLADELRLQLTIQTAADGHDHEIVTLDAASEDALRITHRRYFENVEDLATTAA